MLAIFHNPTLMQEALTHRSAVNESLGKASNERLEFLGDAVLELGTTIFLFERFPEASEGILTSYRASLVRRTMLAQVAATLGLDKLITMSHGEELGGGRKNPALLENTFEAYVGALYLDQGFDACYVFLQENLFTHIDDVIENNLFKDYKSTLQEQVQAQGKATPVYTTLEANGPDHDKTFTVAVSVGDETIATGEGKSKQEASQQAAKRALEKTAQS